MSRISNTAGDVASLGAPGFPGSPDQGPRSAFAEGWRHPYAPLTGHADGALPVMPASSMQIRTATIVLAAFGLATLAVLPVAQVTGPALAGFIPAYQTAVFLFYALSSVHLLAHARRTRLKPLLHIAAGCMFSGMILLIQMFSFPIWGATQLIGSTAATTSWLWTWWHVGPTIFALSYVVALRPGAPLLLGSGPRFLRAAAVAAGAAVMLAATAAAASTWGLPWLPTIVTGDDYSRLLTSGIGPAVLLATLASLALVVWRTRCATMIELCLAVSLALLALDDLPTLLGGSRLSLGWYVGRGEAAISAAILLGFYLMDIDRRFAVVSTMAAALADDRTVLGLAVREQMEANATLRVLARQDGLTGLANRRRLDESLEVEWRRARRNGTALTLLMIDVDHFKLYNDSLGHQAGDICLQKVAELIREVARRPGDLAARYGGEEFAVLLPDTGSEGGRQAAEVLRALLAARRIEHPRARSGRLTVSIGIASIVPDHHDHNFDLLVELADKALYLAKQGGRDQAVVAMPGGVSDEVLEGLGPQAPALLMAGCWPAPLRG